MRDLGIICGVGDVEIIEHGDIKTSGLLSLSPLSTVCLRKNPRKEIRIRRINISPTPETLTALGALSTTGPVTECVQVSLITKTAAN